MCVRVQGMLGRGAVSGVTACNCPPLSGRVLPRWRVCEHKQGNDSEDITLGAWRFVISINHGRRARLKMLFQKSILF